MAEAQQATVEISTELSPYKNRRFENGEKWYLNEDHADVHFTFGATANTGQRIPANKIILATDSRVFNAMFYGDLKEPGDVHVPDTTEAAFMDFLKYFYLSEVKLVAENVAGVLHLGEKYDVKKCVDDCVRFLVHTLDNENVCAYLDLAILYDIKELIELCEKQIMLNTEVVFGTVDFLKCTKKALGHILKIDVFSCVEKDVFEACMSWVNDKVGCADLTIELVEKYLGELYKDIRFASMTMEQLCLLQKQYESVLSRDFIKIANTVVLPESSTLKRNDKWKSDAVIECDRRIEPSTDADELDSDSYTYYEIRDREDLDDEETTVFSATEALILGSLSCPKIFVNYSDGCSDPSDLTVKMEIIESTERYDQEVKKVLLTMKIKLESNGTLILLPHPVLIRPGFFYTIRFGPIPKLHNYYSKHMKEEVQLGSDIIIKFHNYYETSLISKLNFNKI